MKIWVTVKKYSRFSKNIFFTVDFQKKNAVDFPKKNGSTILLFIGEYFHCYSRFSTFLEETHTLLSIFTIIFTLK